MELPCVVEYVRFRNDRGFSVLSCSLNPFSSKYKPEFEEFIKENFEKNKYDTFTVTLGILHPHEDPVRRQYIFIGEIFKDPKYGSQFKANFYFDDEPNTEEALREFLKTLPNIKEARSAAIIERFGVQGTIDVLNDNPMKLAEVNGITEKRVPPIIEEWTKSKNKRELYNWLSSHNVDLALAERIYKEFKDKSMEIIANDPYELTKIYGINFITADNIAHKIIKNISTEIRIRAAIKSLLLEDVKNNSNLCCLYSDLKKQIPVLLQKSDKENNLKENDVKEYLAGISSCIKNNLDLFVAVKDIVSEKGVAYIYLKKIWEREKYIADNLYKRKLTDRKHRPCTDEDIEMAEKDIEQFSGKPVELDKTQEEAIRSAFEHKITVITGGAGSGKSTICRSICYLANKNGLRVRLMSPTGKASRVLSEKTGNSASTIHKSLRMLPENEFPLEKISEDIVIIDEISMVGIDTMFAILYAMEKNVWGNIVLVGDHNQIPSVSPGNFLNDIIESQCANVVKLENVYRQDENSYINILSNEIAKGKIVEIPKNASDVEWHEIKNPESFSKDIRSIVKKYIEDGNDIHDLQIMAPMYRFSLGINKINEVIQDLMSEINHSKNSVFERKFVKFHLHDKVINIKNDYQKNVFNGDIGYIVELGRKVINSSISDKEEDFIVVDFYGERVTYTEEEIEDLKLAWALSIHKFQGSESKNVIGIFSQESHIMNGKEILYTLMTRAKKRLDLYGHINEFRHAPIHSVVRKRCTNLNNLLRELKEGRKILEVLGA